MVSSRFDRPLHILVYTDSTQIGGAEISLGHLLSTASREIRFTLVGVCEPVVRTIAAKRSHMSWQVLPGSGIRGYLSHTRLFHQLRPEIIHLNLCTPWAGAIALSTALTVPQTRVVRVDQLPLRTTDALTLWRTRWLCLRVDAHVAVGEASARRMEDFYALGRHSVISIPNGVPDPGLPDPRHRSASGELVIGSLARLDAMKAHDILLRAIAQVEGTRLVILGEGQEQANLEQLAAELGISHRLELRGWQEQPQQFLPEFDVVAIPSRSEGFPLSMVEAMLAERAIVTTRVGSMPEAIREGQTGLLVEKNDVAGLAAALQQLRDDPDLRLCLGQQARQLALKHFTIESMTQQYEQLWQKVLSLPRRPRLQVPRPLD